MSEKTDRAILSLSANFVTSKRICFAIPTGFFFRKGISMDFYAAAISFLVGKPTHPPDITRIVMLSKVSFIELLKDTPETKSSSKAV